MIHFLKNKGCSITVAVIWLICFIFVFSTNIHNDPINNLTGIVIVASIGWFIIVIPLTFIIAMIINILTSD